ncbi:MAG: hypothetical protein ABMA64_25635 [Myxococcota bacterium]
MTTLLESLTWWPWNAAECIRNVRRSPAAPGLVTLAWATRDPRPTVLKKADGTEVFRDEGPKVDHVVTLTGGAGELEDIVIDTGDFQRVVRVEF